MEDWEDEGPSKRSAPPVVDALVKQILESPPEQVDPPDLIDRLRHDGPGGCFEDTLETDDRQQASGPGVATGVLTATRSPHWLARYYRIRDGIPGQIVFHRRRISAYLRATMNYLIAEVDPEAMVARESVCLVLVRWIYAHEDFHFYADIQRHVSGLARSTTNKQERLLEEGLATAWSRTYILTLDGKTKFVPEAVDWWLGTLSVPGYGDWRDYATRAKFTEGYNRLISGQTTGESAKREVYHSIAPNWSPWCDYWILGEYSSQLDNAPCGWRGMFNKRWADDWHEAALGWDKVWRRYPP
jgi:hypothetical protein